MADTVTPGTSGEGDSKLDWQIATVTSIHDESPRVKLFTLKLPEDTAKRGFFAGQYYDIRLTAPDGYQAQRSYSISSSPDDPGVIELAIEIIEDGEVSSYFHEVVETGDQIELRGPIGGHFTWFPMITRPILLIAGGSGIAPIMSMLRHHRSSNSTAPAVLMFSVRTAEDILFREELEKMANDDDSFDLVITLTREAPSNWNGETQRIDPSMIDSALKTLGAPPDRAYICGGTGFVEAVGNYLLDSGMDYDSIRTERFGP
jgi:ferredoxin-NADP reductase